MEILLAGTTQSKGQGRKDGWVLRIKSNGDILWDKTFGGLWNDEFSAIGLLKDGQIVIAGHSQLEENRESNFWIVKLSSDGDVTFDRKTGGARADRFHALVTRPDGTAIFAGETSSFGKTSVNAIITRLTLDNKLPPKVFPAADNYHISAISSYQDGTLLVAGDIKRVGSSTKDAWVMKLASDGQDILWERVLGGQGDDIATGITSLGDGGLAIVGITASYGQGQDDIWVVKLDKNGTSAPGQ